MNKIFTASQFVPTQWDSAEQKAKFANQYVRFVLSGFKATLFSKWFYQRLSNCFSHIAHYNQGGFFEYWFEDVNKQTQFLYHAVQYPCYGDPTFTYSDVEKVLVAWIKENKLCEKYVKMVNEETESRERAEYVRLQEKFA